MKKLIYLVLVLASCQDPERPQSFEVEDYQLWYPKEWSVDSSSRVGGADVTWYLPMDTVDTYRESVKLVVDRIEMEDVHRFVDISIQQLSGLMPNLEIEQREDVEDRSGQKGVEIQYKVLQGYVHLTYLQRFFLSNGQVFILTFSANQEQFAGLEVDVRECMNSFELKKTVDAQ